MQPVISVEQAVKDLRHEFRNLTNKEFNTGVARAINHSLAKGRTKANRSIGEEYAIDPADVKAHLRVVRANRSTLTGYVGASGGPIPIRKFPHFETKKGVLVEIRKGQLKMIPSAFVQRMPNGSLGVFGRGRYQGKDFAFRNRRQRKNGNDLEINQITTISVPFAFNGNDTMQKTNNVLDTSVLNRIVHELKRMK
jgi:hypothetical protein